MGTPGPSTTTVSFLALSLCVRLQMSRPFGYDVPPMDPDNPQLTCHTCHTCHCTSVNASRYISSPSQATSNTSQPREEVGSRRGLLKPETKMVITIRNDEETGNQETESKEESILAMLGIIGTILNLFVIIFVYIYTTL